MCNILNILNFCSSMSSATSENRITFPVEVGEITHHNLKQLKLVNSLSFPVCFIINICL